MRINDGISVEIAIATTNNYQGFTKTLNFFFNINKTQFKNDQLF